MPNPGGRLAACPRCALEADIGPHLCGEHLELLEEIGRGGMGTVFKARDLRSGHVVAVKILSDALTSDSDFQRRFEREAKTLALLRHPNIVRFHEFGRDDDRAYIVMEYVAGRPLSARIPLPRKRALHVATQACEALAYAHRRGLVHRDIKPQNILLDLEERVKVSDFGIAGFVAGSRPGWTVTAPGSVVGTLEYLAPEALAGAPPDPRMDVYSLGAVLYEMVTGRRPAGYFELPGPPFDRILQRALAPEPERRYATAQDMHQDLISPARTNGAGPSSATKRTRLYLAALVVAVAVLALGMLAWPRSSPLRPTLAAAPPLVEVSATPSITLAAPTPVSTPEPDVAPMPTPTVAEPTPVPDGELASAALPDPSLTLSPTPTPKSEIELRREQGVPPYEAALRAVEEKVKELRKLLDQYEGGCYGTIYIGSENAPFNRALLPECLQLRRQLPELLKIIRASLEAADEIGRRAWLTPGTRRDTVARHKLDDAMIDGLAQAVAVIAAKK
jgi:serine/threonine protein kinase